MKRSTKLFLGAATVWPVLYIFLFITAILGIMALAPQPSDGPPSDLAPAFGIAIVVVFVLHFLTIFLSLGLTVYYIVHAIKNEGLKSDMKAVWAILFFFAGILAEPVYWYLQIWKTPEVNVVGQLGTANSSAWEEARISEPEYVPREPHGWQ